MYINDSLMVYYFLCLEKAVNMKRFEYTTSFADFVNNQLSIIIKTVPLRQKVSSDQYIESIF